MSRATMEDKRTLFGLLHELDPKYVNSVAFVQIVLKFTSFYYYVYSAPLIGSGLINQTWPEPFSGALYRLSM